MPRNVFCELEGWAVGFAPYALLLRADPRHENFPRAAAMHDRETNITVRQMSLSDIREVLELERRVFPEMLRWSEEELRQHISVFPEGQLVAVDPTGRVVGSASSLIIDWDDYAESAKWSSITGQGRFSTHD